jgi:hypothetical protein
MGLSDSNLFLIIVKILTNESNDLLCLRYFDFV